MESLGEMLKSWPTGQEITKKAEQKLAEMLAGRCGVAAKERSGA